AMATGSGLFNPSNLAYDPQLLKISHLSPAQLRPLNNDSTPVAGPLAKLFPELKDRPWFPGIGDGAASNLGSGATQPGFAALNVGTSAALRVIRSSGPAIAPLGLFCYRLDPQRFLVGGAVSNAGNLRSWCLRELQLPDAAATEIALANRPSPAHGLVVLPFWNPERAPTWDEDATGSIHGLRQHSSSLDILQAITEATYHRLAKIADLLLASDPSTPTKFIVSGGIQRSPTSLQRLADVLGKPLHPNDEMEASLRGAAIFAIEKLGLPSPSSPLQKPLKPRQKYAALYAIERAKLQSLEALLAPTPTPTQSPQSPKGARPQFPHAPPPPPRPSPLPPHSRPPRNLPSSPKYPLAGQRRQRPLPRFWLVSEDNGRFLGCYGDPLAHTPTLDQLAKNGVLYERCFAMPVCAPSRFTLITGLYPVTSGPAHHMRAKGSPPPNLQGFPALLRNAGFYTSNHSKTDYNCPLKPSEIWDGSHYKNRPPHQPFFSVFNHEVTHESCLFPTKEIPTVDPAKISVPPYQPDTPEIRADWARYYSHIAQLDSQIAAKLQDLATAGLAEDTIIFYYSDNGGVLPRSKRFLHESGTHVPLIVYYPPKWQHLAPAPPGSRIKDPVHFIDFAPTVLSLLGIPIPAYFQGHPFAGPAKSPPQPFVFCMRDRMDESFDTIRSVADSRYLYIHNYRPDRPYVPFLHYMFQARGYQSWARLAQANQLTPATAMFWGEKPPEELYDSLNDPHNIHNLATDPAQL
ncbi:MAG: sulfatase-like hydrolase/transferase, partial [Verrucomicrobia bacterium]|nr:sulfatase-like hydrolase/transferase [Verrucomicrobiota bacterium]